MSLRRLAFGFLAITAICISACSSKAREPVYTKEQQQKKFVEETAGEMKKLIDMEKKYGMDHPQVKQMKMELGLDTTKPASGQTPGSVSHQ